MTRGELDELVQDCKLELEFDAVCKAFDGLLQDVVVQEFDREEADVEDDDDDIDGEELPHQALGTLLVRRFDDVERFPDVQAAENELLEAEAYHLDPLDFVICIAECVCVLAKV